VDALPALVTRPLLDAYAETSAANHPVAAEPPRISVTSELTDGIPARLALDGGRRLVLAVPLGLARPLLEADPREIVLDDAAIAAAPPGEFAPIDRPRPRLTLIADGRIADTVALVPHVRLRLDDGPRAVLEVIVDRLVVTAGALRGPGRSDSRLVLRWRDLSVAGDTGPAAGPGDPALRMLRGETT
jgi:hypothetical protein